MTISLRRLRKVLRAVCRADTAYNAKRWTPDNPLAEHCTVVALLVQELFDGQLLRVKILPSGRFPKGGWHWYNRLPDGSTVDLTREQFGQRAPRFSEPSVRYRGSVLRIAALARRYALLRSRVRRALLKEAA
ncbi:MAG TPA: hypothetical protein VD862_04800 [Candidatus Paceibacterota bacterium]|nr:hypothetical protein [Candidatus Paceibacterota bacterium]